jgi:HlyD family secretion protein
MKKYIIGIVLLALLTGCASSGPNPSATPTAAAAKRASATGASAQGYLAPVRRANLAFRVSGRVTQVLVKEGDQVKTGQPLIKLQDADLKAALAQAQADLARVRAGARPEEIAAAQANVSIADSQVAAASAELARLRSGVPQAQFATAQADLEKAAEDLKVMQDSYNSITDSQSFCKENFYRCGGLGLREEQMRVQLAAARAANEVAQKRVTQAQTGAGSDLLAAQARVETAQAQRDAAQARLDLLKAGATTEQIDGAKARVAQAQAALDEATLLASFDGIIAELPINLGEMVAPGVRVASIADLSNWQVETDDLSEVDVVNVQPGAAVSVTVDALPGVTLTGQVTSITPRSAVKRGDVTYTVKIALANPDPRLKWGMTAFVDIHSK